MSQTIGQRMASNRGVGGSFDLIRLVAALAVLFSHSVPLTTGASKGEFIFDLSGGRTSLGDFAVDIFFVTSGFLVTASLFRSSSLLDFAWRRAVRIMPALVFVVLTCAFVVGPIFSSQPLLAYLQSRQTYVYLLNAVFYLHDALPGVFQDNPYAGAVNGSLWTLFYEVACYASVSLLIFFRSRAALLAPIAAICLGILAARHGWQLRFEHFFALGSFFFAGAVVYVLRDRIPYQPIVFVISLFLVGAMVLWGPVPFVSQLAMAYACVWLGFQRSFEPPGDYSYGVYLWAFPIQQILLATLGRMPWWENAALALLPTLAAAYVSWTFVESRAMGSKNLMARFRGAPHGQSPGTGVGADGSN